LVKIEIDCGGKRKKMAFKDEIYTPGLQALNLFDFFNRAYEKVIT